MKTIADIKTDIANLIKDSGMMGYKEKEKARQRVLMLRQCMMLLEANPSKESLAKQYDECYDSLKAYDLRLDTWIDKQDKEKLSRISTTPRKYYYDNVAPNELKEIKSVNERVAKLSYILT